MKTIKHELTTTHPDGIKWMLNKEFIFVEDVLGLIDERIKRLKQQKQDCCDKWYCETCNVILSIIRNLEELKTRITG